MVARSSISNDRRLGSFLLGIPRWILLTISVLPGGCADSELSATKTEESASSIAAPRFQDVSATAGLDFVHDGGARGEFLYPETMGGGGGFFDADGDGNLDLFLVDGGPLPPEPPRAGHRLYRSLDDGRLEDVTEAAGIQVPHYGMGCVAADLDNDGDQDLLVTGVERNLLYRNQGDGTFQEIGSSSGLPRGRWSTSATFFDYDRDGVLDLALGYYAEWSLEIDRAIPERRCITPEGVRDYCPVALYQPEEVLLFRGRGDGTFEEVSERAGFGGRVSRVLGLLVLDFDGDGWLDLFVANDTTPSQLFHNRGDGTFQDIGYECGLALNQWGNSFAGMGVDVTHEQNGEVLALCVGNFSGEPVTFHRQQRDSGGKVLVDDFLEQSTALGLSTPTLRMVTFGLGFVDYDRDGQEDLFLVNGNLGRMQEFENIPYEQPCQVFRRTDRGFAEVRLPPDSPLAQPIVGRGLAFGDWNDDGAIDLLIPENQGPCRLLVQEPEPSGQWFRVALQGTRSNRNGIGALVTVHCGERVLRDRVITGSSYLAMNELTLTFGIGSATSVDRLEVRWPSGIRDVLTEVPANQTLTILEGDTGAEDHRLSPTNSFASYDELSLSELQERAALHPDRSQLWKAVGLRALEQGNTDLALEALPRAVRLAPDDSVAALHEVRALAAAGRKREVVTRLGEMFDHFGADRMTLDVYYDFIQLDEPVAAEALLGEALRRDPGSALLHFQLGWFLSRYERFQESMESYQAAFDHDPSSAEALVGKARSALRLNRWKEAAKACRAALQVDPAAQLARTLLAESLISLSRTTEAAELLLERLKSHPAEGDVRWKLIEILRGAERSEEALRHIRKLNRHNPERCDGWQLLLLQLRHHENRGAALRSARDAVAACPRSGTVLYLAAMVRSDQEDEPAAILQLLRDSVGYEKDHRKAWKMRARLAGQLGHRQEARQAWQEVLRLDPQDSEALRFLDSPDGS